MILIGKEQTYQTLSEYYHHAGTLQHMALREALDRVPVVDAVPVRHGKWIKHEIGHENVPWGFDCSECGEWFVIGQEIIKRYKHCPNCGARMDEE